MRHPQYDGFLLIMIGFPLQWPTIPTVVMFPVLVFVYTRLARADQVVVVGKDHRVHAVAEPELHQDALHVGPDRETTKCLVDVALTRHFSRGGGGGNRTRVLQAALVGHGRHVLNSLALQGFPRCQWLLVNGTQRS